MSYIAGEAAASGVTLIANPQPGVVRIAGIAGDGFANGLLYSARFRSTTSAAPAMRLVIRELHTRTGGDALAKLVVRDR